MINNTAQEISPKYEFGDRVYWVEAYTNYSLQIPCPMCFGKKFVTIILGNDEHQKIECGACSYGLDAPNGIATTWGAYSVIKSGTIKGIRKHEEKWIYEIGYSSIEEDRFFINEEAAIPERDKKLKEMQILADRYHRDHFINAKKSQIWNCNYHLRQIKSHERSIEWHKAKLDMIKELKP